VKFRNIKSHKLCIKYGLQADNYKHDDKANFEVRLCPTNLACAEPARNKLINYVDGVRLRL
jgi:hypothetical protein